MPGSVIVLYGTGAGPLEGADEDGQIIGDELPVLELPVEVLIDGVKAQLLYAGGAPGLVNGVVQLNVRLPFTARSGSAVPVTFIVDGVATDSSVTVAIQSHRRSPPYLCANGCNFRHDFDCAAIWNVEGSPARRKPIAWRGRSSGHIEGRWHALAITPHWRLTHVGEPTEPAAEHVAHVGISRILDLGHETHLLIAHLHSRPTGYAD